MSFILCGVDGGGGTAVGEGFLPRGWCARRRGLSPVNGLAGRSPRLHAPASKCYWWWLFDHVWTSDPRDNCVFSCPRTPWTLTWKSPVLMSMHFTSVVSALVFRGALVHGHGAGTSAQIDERKPPGYAAGYDVCVPAALQARRVSWCWEYSNKQWRYVRLCR